MSLKDFKDKAAIVGVGNTLYNQMYRTRDPLRSSYSLGAQAFKNALEDSGLCKEDIDGVIVCRIPSYKNLCLTIGLPPPRITHILPGEGRQAGMALQYAAQAIYSGMANTVACIYGNDGRSANVTYGAEEGWYDNYNAPYGMSSPGASWALMWQRYMHEFNAREDALGYVAIVTRKYAALNPDAVMKTPLTMEEYNHSRYITYPLRILDYCLINDGGVCFIVTSAERARNGKKLPVYVMGTAQVGKHTPYHHTPTLYYDEMKMVADRVYSMAGVGPKDIDCAQIYDNFLPIILFCLEGYGFCAKGEGGIGFKMGESNSEESFP